MNHNQSIEQHDSLYHAHNYLVQIESLRHDSIKDKYILYLPHRFILSRVNEKAGVIH